MDVAGTSRPVSSNWILVVLILANVAGTIAQTLPRIEGPYGKNLQLFDRFCVLVFAIEYLARMWVAPEHPLLRKFSPSRARLRFAATPMMIIDALAFVPLVLELLFPGVPNVRLTRLVRFLKLARYSPALGKHRTGTRGGTARATRLRDYHHRRDADDGRHDAGSRRRNPARPTWRYVEGYVVVGRDARKDRWHRPSPRLLRSAELSRPSR